jgi:hypothetical protein
MVIRRLDAYGVVVEGGKKKKKKQQLKSPDRVNTESNKRSTHFFSLVHSLPIIERIYYFFFQKLKKKYKKKLIKKEMQDIIYITK